MLTLACVAESRCYLELEELDVARQRLSDALEMIEPHVKGHLRTLLTSNAAAYLHPALKGRINLQRLTRLLRWLDPKLENENAVFEELREPLTHLVKSPGAWVEKLPPAIWDPKFDPADDAATRAKPALGFSIPDMSIRVPSLGKVDIPAWRVKLPGLGGGSEAAALERLPAVMGTMESMVEDMRRFQGYGAEVQEVRKSGLTFREWHALAAPAGSHATRYLVNDDAFQAT